MTHCSLILTASLRMTVCRRHTDDLTCTRVGANDLFWTEQNLLLWLMLSHHTREKQMSWPKWTVVNSSFTVCWTKSTCAVCKLLNTDRKEMKLKDKYTHLYIDGRWVLMLPKLLVHLLQLLSGHLDHPLDILNLQHPTWHNYLFVGGELNVLATCLSISGYGSA